MADDVKQAMHSHIAGLEKKFGKPISYWADMVLAWNEPKHMVNVKRLKDEFGLGHGHASMVVHLAKQNTSAHTDDADLFVEMFAGKEVWKPLYDALVQLVKEVSSTIEFSPKKKYVSLRTHKQIGSLIPAAKGRFEVQLNLKGVPAEGMLEEMKPGQMCSHVVKITDPEFRDFDDLKNWIERAFLSAEK